MQTRLSVNLNKVALIRNSRGGNNPDLIRVAKDCEAFGAEGITIHPRPDQRHARYSDISTLKAVVTTELNVEGYPTPELLEMVLEHRPHQFTMVPDPPGVLTSSEGWAIKEQASFLKEIIDACREKGIRTSLFIEPTPARAEEAAKVGADRIEMYTGHYASQFIENKSKAIQPYIETAKATLDAGLSINAGHDLNLDNLAYFKAGISELAEVSIGHALICDALYFGLKNTIQMYLNLLR
ncbi:MAG: pyridoxine 5'-phosphate synthase [Saprospiraceae bacterium]|nr:pyridoxine 5'-phosphate synthase [Saprospiraceae bacterium]MBK8850651.1 pyridoxine 5'-phosphate synthase [Saprospiraceae bacterium]